MAALATHAPWPLMSAGSRAGSIVRSRALEQQQAAGPARRPMCGQQRRRQQQQQQQQQQRAAVRRRATRGGGPDQDSDSESEDYFMTAEGGSLDEFYDSDDEDLFGEADDGGIRFYLDSADVKAWEEWAETGLFYGFTTNPTILKRDSVQCTIPSMRQLTRQAGILGAQELQLQAWGATAVEMYRCGLDLMDLEPQKVVVKLPLTLEGAKAARRLVADGVPVTMTGVYARHQVVSAIALGAAYAAPYVGRMTDAGKNGVEEALAMQSIVDLGSGEGEMRLLVASLRSADEVAALAEGGCNTFTFSPAVAQQLFGVQLTNEAALVFQQHADEMGAMQGH